MLQKFAAESNEFVKGLVAGGVVNVQCSAIVGVPLVFPCVIFDEECPHILLQGNGPINTVLKSLGLRKSAINFVSCPTCGRTAYDMQSLAELIYQKTISVTKPIKIAVMGCVVNGPGEAADCDIGIAGSKKTCVIFKKGEPYKTVPFENAEEEFIKEIKEIANPENVATIQIEVLNKKPEIYAMSNRVSVGEKIYFNVRNFDELEESKLSDFVWSLNDPTIAKINDDFSITALKEGKVTLTATASSISNPDPDHSR